MYLIREVFKAKPGKAKELVKMFKQAIPHFEQSEGCQNYKVMTDIVSDYWTVVMEYEVDNIGGFIVNKAPIDFHACLVFKKLNQCVVFSS